ncbi:MAG: hypothetical protein ABIT70_14575 [Sulfuriferula sp.]
MTISKEEVISIARCYAVAVYLRDIEHTFDNDALESFAAAIEARGREECQLNKPKPSIVICGNDSTRIL